MDPFINHTQAQYNDKWKTLENHYFVVETLIIHISTTLHEKPYSLEEFYGIFSEIKIVFSKFISPHLMIFSE